MNRWFVVVAVFVAAASVLVLEIVAGRILAPYVGVSLQTFTGIIGTILAAIALGAWLGGRFADRHDPDRILGPLLIAGGVLAIVTPAFVHVFGPSVQGESPVVIVLLAAIGFFLPAAVLSAVTPVAAKALLASVEETGTVVGSLSAIGTSGALFGTFVTGFVLVAAMPSQPITWIVGLVLVVLGIAQTIRSGQRIVLSSLVVFSIAVLGSSAVAAPCDYETAYSCAIVTQRGDDPSVKALVLDTFVNSVVDVDDPAYLGSRYARTIAAVVEAEVPGGPGVAAYIGGGAMTLPQYYHATASSRAVVLELDAHLPEIAESDLGLEPGPWLEVVTGDARLTLRALADHQFDLMVGDAFSGRSVPWHLTTVEFMQDVEVKLADAGVYVMNVIDHPPFGFVDAEVATLAAVFDHVAIVAPPNHLARERGGNFVLVGANDPIPKASILSALTDGEEVLVDRDAVDWAGGAPSLTDAFAPADQLLSRP